MAKIVILGAGPTGLSAAYHLEKKGFFDYKIFEKEETVGGLCRSIQHDGFTFDYTGHLLHIGDTYFKQFIESVVGMHNFNAILRRSFLYSQGVYTRYPYQINLFGLPEETIVECIEGYVSRPVTHRKPRSFHEWVLTHFGKGFGKHFFFPYQKKVLAYDIHNVSASWTGRFVPSTSLKQIIRGAVVDHQETLIGYNAKFFYPKSGGINFWVNKLANHLHSQIHTTFCVSSVNLKEKFVTFSNGHHEPYDHLINTIPLDSFLRLIQEPSSSRLASAADKLLCNRVVNFNLGVAHPNISEKHWIYYPEKQYPFYRLGFYHNFSSSMTPDGCSSLYGEFAHLRTSASMVNRLLKRSLKDVKRLLKIDDHDVVTEKVVHIDHAYVIYDFWRERNLGALHKRLHEYKVHSIGRYGEWKYSSMQEAVLDGKKIADLLVVIPAQQAHHMPGEFDFTEHGTNHEPSQHPASS